MNNAFGEIILPYQKIDQPKYVNFQIKIDFQKQLERFVIDTPGFNRHSYGEIHFAHRGNLSTYSPVGEVIYLLLMRLT